MKQKKELTNLVYFLDCKLLDEIGASVHAWQMDKRKSATRRDEDLPIVRKN